MASKVLSVRVTDKCHSPLNQPADGCKQTGSSEIRWGFRGTFREKGRCAVVLEADKPRDAKGSKVNPQATGGVFEDGSDGPFCELVLDASDQDNWTVRVATPRDTSKGDAIVFQAGTGFAAK